MDYTADIIRAQAGHGTAAVTSPATGMPPFAANLHTLALDHVDFSLAPGETVAVMGPSGSGKSTLLHALAGIIRPTAGDVTFRGTDLTAMSDADRTKLRRGAFGFVFQSGQLLPELPAVENIALPLMLGGADYRAAVDQAMLWLERLGLRALASHRPGEMSGGQMQRVAIARALAVRPAVVFADEPTGALDQATGREVMGILMDAAHANGAAVVVVTHDPNVAAFCSRTVMMRDGRLGVGDDRDAGRGVDDGDGVDTVDPVTAGSVSGTAATPAVDPFTANPADPGRGWIGGAR
ncbi:ABC transporter ATP-binding protein [Bifidobacterium leontopitheci]|uniref:ABC transporter ATP-binding protein n=2 Tax=Bifidobacterium leontopitheci TaxID=2650774 RepID=A0A6I1GP66_9BIFI|nr:ABC transporter ATP-binding protein [Bifidobacterium leontopitheci]KAB7791087.1 ABC transporter ATP-binding protein [Bifidobacterium leontopitheci]